jgi:pyridoxamine 5'-phosphate oxidase-like protein
MREPSPSRPFMPGYGIDTSTDGLLPWSWAEDQLTKSRNFWLVTHSAHGRPHAMPVWAIWHEAMLWFSSGLRSRKARNLAQDARCVLTTEDAANPVVVEGSAERLTDRADLEHFLAIMNAKYATGYGFEMVDPEKNGSYRLRPTWAFALQSAQFERTPTRWTFGG